mgnify:CR=1 FL=1|tara:strand:+ start:1338 stop:2057 length:720 start_codon:yes stop_codon:yes gene_type:complete
MIQVLLLIAVLALSLLPFFRFFRGSPHQLASIAELEQSLPQELLDEDAAWFETWRASGIDQEIKSRYFRQELSNECFSAAAAMVAAHWGKIQGLDEYNRIREKFGHTTSVQAQVKALESLGLDVEFRTDADSLMIELEIEMGRPVITGWVHSGPVSEAVPPSCNGAGCGHYSVITGFAARHSSDPEWIMQDPRGLPLLREGGHDLTESGRNVRVRQAEFKPRFEVEGPQTGWVILVDGS